MTARISIRNPFTLPGKGTGDPRPVEHLEVATLNGQVVVTPARIERAGAVRAKLAELDLTAQDVRDAVTWARETIATPVAKGNRAPDAMAASRPKSTSPRVVLETDLVLSALVFSGGATAVLRTGWQRRQFTPLASKAMAGELMGGLARPRFALTTDEQEDLLFDYLLFCETVEVPVPPPAIPIGLDPFDVPSLELAIAGRANCLVTGNRDLLSRATETSCPIVGADDFLVRLEPE